MRASVLYRKKVLYKNMSGQCHKYLKVQTFFIDDVVN